MRVVIAGSAKLQDEIEKWVEYWNSQDDCTVLDYPQLISKDGFDELYPNVFKDFFRKITEADVLFVANERKNGIDGYIGAGVFAELGFGLAQKMVYGKDIKIILANRPGKEVVGHDELSLWIRLGWIDKIFSRDQ